MAEKSVDDITKKFLTNCKKNKKEKDALEKIEKLFLSVPLTPLSEQDSLDISSSGQLSEQDYLNIASYKQLTAPLKAQYSELKTILESCSNELGQHSVIWLFFELQKKAHDEIVKYSALAQTIKPESFVKHGVPEEVVGNARAIQDYAEKKGAKVSITTRASKAGKGNLKRKEPERKAIKNKFLEWKSEKLWLYTNNDDFAEEMRKTYPDCSHSTITKKWCVEWAKELKK